MRILLCLLLFAIALPLSAQLAIGDFECQAPGTTPPVGTPDCEGWSTVGGTPYVVAGPVTGPAGPALPPAGLQQLEVCSAGTGPAAPVVAPSTPGTYPFAVGTVCEATYSLTIPAFSSGITALTFDWYFTTDEAQAGSGGGYDDFAQIALIDAISGQLMQTLLYVDTYSPYLLTAGNTVPTFGGITHLSYAQPVTNETVLINPNLVGQPMLVSIVVANQGDGGIDSALFVDQMVFVDGGSIFSLTLQTTGGGVGDFTFGVQGLPGAATDVLILLSSTPAPGGLGTGPAFGLTPDSLFFATLFQPSVPLGLTHFPTASSPFAGGNFSFPAGAVSSLAGQTWEGIAIGYSLGGFWQLSNPAQAAF